MRASESRISSSSAAAVLSRSSSLSLSARVSSINAVASCPALLQRAHLLAQFIAPGLERLCLGDGLAAPLVEGAKVAQQDGRVGAARTQLFFHRSRLPRTNCKSSMALVSLQDEKGASGRALV